MYSINLIYLSLWCVLLTSACSKEAATVDLYEISKMDLKSAPAKLSFARHKGPFKIAAVYDYASIARAANQKHKVVYFGFDSAVALNPELRHQIKTQAEKIRGIDPESFRVSLESASLSVSFDPQCITCPALKQTLETQLKSKKLSLFVSDIEIGSTK